MRDEELDDLVEYQSDPSAPDLLMKFGTTISVNEAYRYYRQNHLPWWRRWFWPRLNSRERAIANLIALYRATDVEFSG